MSMIQIPPQSFAAWRVALTVLHVVALSFAAFRVFIRWRSKKMWWDDYLVLLPFFADLFICIALWRFPLMSFSNGGILFGFWISLFPCYMAMWISRVVLALSLARIFPESNIHRRISLFLAASFTMIFIVTMTSNALRCVLTTTPMTPKFPVCIRDPKDRSAIMFLIFFIADLACDLTLVVYPLYMFWRVKLRPPERRMILFTFASSIVVCFMPILFIFLNYGPVTPTLGVGIVLVMVSHLEAISLLIVCNLLIIVAFGFRTIRRIKIANSADGTTEDSEKETSQKELTTQSGRETMNTNTYSTRSMTHISLTQISDEWSQMESGPV